MMPILIKSCIGLLLTIAMVEILSAEDKIEEVKLQILMIGCVMAIVGIIYLATQTIGG